MSKYKNKTSNDDLISIYRMDFYKKKKNWKFTNNVKKESSKPKVPRREQSVTSLLNVTYDMNPQENNSPKELNDLNDALKKTDTDKQEHNSPKELEDFNNAFKEFDIDRGKQKHNSPNKLEDFNNAFKEFDTDRGKQEHNSPNELEDFNNAFNVINIDRGKQEHNSPNELEDFNNAFNVINIDRGKQEHNSPNELEDFNYAFNEINIDQGKQEHNSPNELEDFNYAFNEINIDQGKQEHNSPNELEDYNNAVKEFDLNGYQQEHTSPKELNDLNNAFIAVDSACCGMPLQQDYHPGTVDDLFILPQYPSRNFGLQVVSPEFGQYFRQAQWPQQLMDYGENVIDGTTHVLEKSTNSLESLTEFIRGAHCAPHSSEIQLNIPVVPQSDLSTEALAQLPNKVLHALLQEHRNMVQLLLKEASARMRVQPESLSLENCRYYTSYVDISSDIPTRDIGPYSYTDIDQISMQHDVFHKPDYFLAGSSQIGRGRGRGRCIENCQLYGLGRGRNRNLRNLNNFFAN